MRWAARAGQTGTRATLDGRGGPWQYVASLGGICVAPRRHPPEALGRVEVSDSASQCLCERLRRPCFDHRVSRQGFPDQRWQVSGRGSKSNALPSPQGWIRVRRPPLHRLAAWLGGAGPEMARRARQSEGASAVLVVGGNARNGRLTRDGGVLSQAPVGRRLAGSGIPRSL